LHLKPPSPAEKTPPKEFDRFPFTNSVPKGRLKISQDEILGALLLQANALASYQEHPGFHPGKFSAVPSGTDLFVHPTQDYRPGLLSASLVQIRFLRGGGKPARLKLGFSKKPISIRRSFPP
jgi:hypothetical protein